MPLKSYQREIQLDTVYEVSKLGGVSGSELDGLTLWVDAGSVDIHACNSATKPTTLSDFTLSPSDTGVSGLVEFETLARYIAIVQNTGTTTELVLTGINVDAGTALV